MELSLGMETCGGSVSFKLKVRQCGKERKKNSGIKIMKIAGRAPRVLVPQFDAWRVETPLNFNLRKRVLVAASVAPSFSLLSLFS